MGVKRHTIICVCVYRTFLILLVFFFHLYRAASGARNVCKCVGSDVCDDDDDNDYEGRRFPHVVEATKATPHAYNM